MARAEFEWIQARLQARVGDVQRTVHWAAIEASRGAAEFLAALRGGALAGWVEGFDATTDPHHVEQALRVRWIAYVDDVARWQPRIWSAATRWFALVTDLARIDAARKDARLAPSAARQDSAGDARASSAPFTKPYTRTGEDSTLSLWRVGWDRRVPRDGFDAATLLRPAQMLVPALAGDASGRARHTTATRAALVRLFRRHAATPIAVFAYLGLVALDVERLRGGWVARRMLGPIGASEGGG